MSNKTHKLHMEKFLKEKLLIRIGVKVGWGLNALELGDLPWMDSPLPDNRHPVLKAVDPVGNLGEVVYSQGFLLAVEGTVVSSSA